MSTIYGDGFVADRMARESFEAWLIARQRAKGFGARLTDDEMLAGMRRAGSWSLDDVWEILQTYPATSAPVSGVEASDKPVTENGNG
jgi:hypothetical protein